MLRLTLLALLIPSVFCAFGGLVGRSQSASVRGTLVCNGKPEKDVLVKLYDDDREGTTDVNGFFEIGGYNYEISKIDPKLNIYHDCNDGWWPCQRKISIMIPDEYITDGDIPRKSYDIGRLELAGQFKGETRDCLH